MTRRAPDEEFWNLADNFIELANQHLSNTEPERISSALLYAAARFNAFVVAAAADGDLENERGPATEYLVDQYRKMLEDNFSDYIDNPL